LSPLYIPLLPFISFFIFPFFVLTRIERQTDQDNPGQTGMYGKPNGTYVTRLVKRVGRGCSLGMVRWETTEKLQSRQHVSRAP